MISRYTLPEMGRIWSDENKFAIWLRIEILACEAQAELGVAPKSTTEVDCAETAFGGKRVLKFDGIHVRTQKKYPGNKAREEFHFNAKCHGQESCKATGA